MTTYQDILRGHLIRVLGANHLITETVLLQYSEHKMVVGLCAEFDYIPVFGQVIGEYCTFNGIRATPPC